MFRIIKQVFIALLNPDKHNQGMYHYLFMINLGTSNRSCNTLDKLSTIICVLNQTEDVNLNAFNMITGINESKALTKHISWDCKCEFDGRKCNSNQKWNNDKCRCECKNPIKDHVYKRYYI